MATTPLVEQSTTFPSHLEPLPPSSFEPTIVFKQYTTESELQALTSLIDSDLSEPYSVFTYRVFVNNHPELCFMVYDGGVCIGGAMSKVDVNKNGRKKGYIGMLVVNPNYRGQRLGSQLVRLSMKSMYLQGVDICLLETECCNHVALSLYENLGFLRTKLLPRYYMNNADAYRLKFWLTPNVLLSNHIKLTKQQEEQEAAVIDDSSTPSTNQTTKAQGSQTKVKGKATVA
jgi:peptide alpha-N-acetyltransferase